MIFFTRLKSPKRIDTDCIHSSSKESNKSQCSKQKMVNAPNEKKWGIRLNMFKVKYKSTKNKSTLLAVVLWFCSNGFIIKEPIQIQQNTRKNATWMLLLCLYF